MNTKEPKPPSNRIIDKIATLAQRALELNPVCPSTRVEQDAETKAFFDAYNLACDNEINSNPDNEAWRQMWNRAHLKAMRIAAIFAVCENDLAPVTTIDQARWAVDLVSRDIELMKKKFEGGDIGVSDSSREKKLLSICKDYLVKDLPPTHVGFNVYKKDVIIPRQYLQVRSTNQSTFYKHALGATRAMDMTIRSLCESGHLRELDKNVALLKYNCHGKLYQVLSVD